MTKRRKISMKKIIELPEGRYEKQNAGGSLPSRLRIAVAEGNLLEIDGLKNSEQVHFVARTSHPPKYYIGHGNQELSIGDFAGMTAAEVQKWELYTQDSLRINYALQGNARLLIIGGGPTGEQSFTTIEGRTLPLEVLALNR
jgi:hypothetical protein